MKKGNCKNILILILIFLFIFPNFVWADNGPKLINPLPFDNIIDVVLRIIKVVLGLVDILTLFMFIIGGFQFIISAGNPEMIKRGKDTLAWAIIGLVIITMSYAILKFVFESFSII
jgi:hypothetical protein